MDIRNTYNLKNFLETFSQKLADSDKFFTGKLATRLSKAAAIYPNDNTLVQMASFLDRRSNSNNGHFISRAELKNVYNSLYTSNTRAGDYLADELGINNSITETNKMTRHANEGESITNPVDHVLVSALESAFDKDVPYKPGYNPNVAKVAEKYVAGSLPGSPSVKAIDGREYAILCQASYNTPKGISNVLIPVEVSNGQPLFPTVFVSPDGFIDLTADAIKSHLLKTAGKSYRIDVGKIFEMIRVFKYGSKQGLDDVDMAILSLKSQDGTPITHDPNGILYQKLASFEEPVKISKSKDVEKFAERLSSTAGEAEFIFGKTTIKTAYGIVKMKFAELGYNNAQIKLSNYDDNSLTYSVAINGAGLNVPVKLEKLANNKYDIKVPTVVLSGSNLELLNKEGILNALGQGDQKAFASAIGLDLATSQQLLTEAENACDVGDYKKAGEIANILNDRGDETAFKYAFDLYMQTLNSGKIQKKASPKMKVIRSGGHLVEATTGLPADKVYIDENGHVQMKYRQNMEKTDNVSAAGFMHAKILMGM